ncbi:hypothetical protein MMC14_002574 [Varicellaria rhodocarpa]|nr:hypothetical protein [Varicellaria rhodocarpa]
MAHKSRKKGKANPQVKTRHLTDSDGWTHIIRGPSQTSERFVSNSPYEAIHSGKVEIPEGFTLERAQEKYKGCVRRWESSMCYKWLVNLFEQTILKVRTLRIDSCMVTGLGSFTKSEVTGNDSSFYQLAAFETLLRILKQRFDIRRVNFQEPIFTALDEDLLVSKGFTIIQDPEAYSLMTQSTFLYAPCNEWNTIFSIIRSTHPALYIGNELTSQQNHCRFNTHSDRIKNSEEGSERGQQNLWDKNEVITAFLEGRSLEVITEFETNISAMNSVIYWCPDTNEVQDTGQPSDS